MTSRQSVSGAEVHRPRILFAGPYIPFVPSQGGLTRAFHTARALAEVADVLVVGAMPAYPQANLDSMHSTGAQVHVLPVPPGVLPRPFAVAKDIAHALEFRYGIGKPIALLADWARALRHTLSVVRRYDQAPYADAVRTLLAEGSYDLLVVGHSYVAEMLMEVVQSWGGPSIVDFQNVVSVYEERVLEARLRQAGRPAPTPAEARMVDRFRSMERQVLSTFDRAIATSDVDAAYLRELAPGTAVHVIPNGVDVGYFAGAACLGDSTSQIPDHSLIFLGTLSHPPNVDALQWFVAGVWPLIRARWPDARFTIVGAAPVPRVVRMLAKGPGIELIESVDDVRPFLARSAVSVVPLRTGSGTRLKILEALAAGVPVVSTTMGAEGLALQPGRDLLIADDPAAFTEAVSTLFERPGFGAELASHGRDRAAQLYSWASIGREFQSVALDLLALPNTASRLEGSAR